MIIVAALLATGISFSAKAAIAVRATSVAYYQTTTTFTAGGAPYVVGVGAAVAAASGPVTAPIPAGIVAGDRLLCIVESHDNVATSTPTGWTRLYRNRPGTEYSQAYYKTAVGTETTQTFAHTAGGSIIGQCSAYRNASTASAPLTGGLAGTGANVKSGTVTTTFANELLLMSAHLNQGATTTAGWTMSTPGGLTWTQQYVSTTALGSGSSIGLFSATKAAAGAQTAVTATIAGTVNGSSLNYGALIDWKPGPVINKPAGTVAGDLMVLAIAARSSTAIIYPPPGWTLLLSTTETTTTTTSKLSTYYKIAGASEPASYPWSASVESVASLVSFSGVDSTTPFDGVTPLATPNTAATTTQIAPSITPASANDWLVTVHELTSTPCSGSFTNGWNTIPTGMNEQIDTCSRTSSSTSGMGMEMLTQQLTTAGVATGTKTATAAANAARGISQSLVLRPYAVPAPDHIRIQHNGGACSGAGAPANITLIACANASCSTVYNTANVTGAVDVTGAVFSPTSAGYTLAPVNPQTITAASGSVGITLARSTAGTATLSLSGTISPTPLNTYECYNKATGTSGDCNLVYSGSSFTLSVPDHTSDSSQVVSVTSCKASFASTSRSVTFWSTYINPATGTQTGKIVAGTGNTNCSTGYTALGISSASPTSLSLSFGTGITPSATFTMCYPDAGKVQLDLRYDGSSATGDAGTVLLGSDQFIAAPHHFTLSNIVCGSGGSPFTGCRVASSPYTNPGAANASGLVFTKAGDSFALTVSAYNTNGAVTPNFGKKTTPEGVTVTPVANMPDLLAGAVTGNVSGTFGAFSNGVAIADGITFQPGGILRSIPFSYSDVGIIKLSAKLASGQYLGSAGLKEVTTPATGNIGRFIPDRFTVTTDPDSPIVTQADFSQIFTTVSAPAAIGATTIDVAATTDFNVGSKVRIPGAGTGGNTLTAIVTAVDDVALTLTLNTAIGTAQAGDGTEKVFAEWGSYMGEQFNAQFILNAVALGGSNTKNYSGVYAKLNPASVGSLSFGAVSAGSNLTSRLGTSTSPTGAFPAPGSTLAGSADITAPLFFTALASPDGPYAALMLGIAPSDTDSVQMGSYNLSMGGSPDHTSIMDVTVQASTEVRYGRIRMSNAYGSERLRLPVAATVQYYTNLGWVNNTDDSLTNFDTSTTDMSVSIVKTPLAVGNVTAFNAGTVTVANGVGSFTLNSPNVIGSADISINAATYLTPIAGRVTFGVYKSNQQFIYRRENY